MSPAAQARRRSTTRSASARRSARDVGPVQLQAAQDAVGHPEGRVERAERVLEHHRYVAAVGQRSPARPQRSTAARPGSRSRPRSGCRPWRAAGRRCSCRCRSRRPARRSPGADREVHVVDGVQGLPGDRAADLEVAGQPAGLDQRHGAARRRHGPRRAPTPAVIAAAVHGCRCVQVAGGERAAPSRTARAPRRQRSKRVRAARRGTGTRTAGAAGSGGLPGMPVSGDARPADRREGVEQPPRVRDARACRTPPGWRRSRRPARRT